MPRAGTLKPTLQLRHQLNCSGITIDAAAYDTRRHHLLTYDSHALKPHTLRLFSLRREIRWTPLFDGDNPSPKDVAVATTPLRYVSLVYAYELDVFMCVYSVRCGYSVLFLEPASLKKLVVYDGPPSHLLGCACFDEASGRLVLASRILQPPVQSAGKSGTNTKAIRVATASDVDHSNIIQVVAVSKRSFRRPTSALSVAESTSRSSPDASPPDHTMLCVERQPRATLRHGDELSCVAAARELVAIFGSGVLQYDDGKGSPDCVVVEWRQDPEGGSGLVFVRRIVFEGDVITSLAAAASGQWIFTGHHSGTLKVWSVVHNDVISTMTEDGEMTEVRPRLVASSDAHKSAVATIEFKTQTRSHDGGMVLFTTERECGETRHWRFSAVSSELAPPPQLDCLSFLDVAPGAKMVKPQRRKRGVEQWTRTHTICIGVSMGSYTENLLVVTRGDVIHVIKIHALLQVVHDIPSGEEIFTLRSLPSHDGSSALVCFSGTDAFNRLRVSWLNASASEIHAPRDYFFTAPAQAAPGRTSVRVTRLQVCLHGTQDARIVCGWSTGVVEIYGVDKDASSPHRVLLLQDPRLDSDISAVAIIVSSKSAVAPATIDPQRSWGGHFKPQTASRSTSRGDSKRNFSVFAGSANGGIFGWQVAHLSGNHACQFVLEATIALVSPPAHSAHVVDLLPVAFGSGTLLSLGADGMVKLWEVPSMRLTGHINAAAAVGAGGTRLTMLCSCVQTLEDTSIAVGYEDGAIGVWRRETRGADREGFVELAVHGQHERRVSHLVQLPNSCFASASLDMTIVLWSIIHDSNRVDELRFFELGAPVVDCCVVGCLVIAALKEEVCWFSWNDGSKATSQSLPLFCDEQQLTLQATSSGHNPSEDPTDARLEDSSPSADGTLPLSSPTTPEAEESGVISIPSVVVPGSLATFESFGVPPRTSFGGSTSGAVEGWRTDQSSDQLLDSEVITVFLQQFVASSGSSGTVAAETLGHFMAMHHLPMGKRSARPDFTIRKYLHAHKIDPKTRLNATEATTLLLEIQRELQSSGVGRAIEEGAKRNAADSSETRKKKQNKQDALVARMAQPRSKKERILSDKQSSNRVAVVTYNILGEKTIKWIDSNQDAESSPTPPQTGEMDPEPVERSPPRWHRRVKSRIAPSTKRQKRSLPPPELLERLHISPCFETGWTAGYCWCSSSEVSVRWEEKEKDDSTPDGDTKCDQCHQRFHVVTLHSKGYTPHFTVRMIMGIVSDVYAQLKESAEMLLFQSDGSEGQDVAVSVHAALWRLFQHKYGVQRVVETKLKLLFVSMCHFVRDVDAIAVFGELLGLFQRPNSDDEQVPQKMVALCVAMYNWLYAREMVVNGEPIVTGSSGDEDSSSDRGGGSHWQFVSLKNALFCAQEVLVYPLVSPGYLRNILMYMDDYSQGSASKPLLEDADARDQSAQDAPRWIEVHRLLRLLVGEWKQQTSEFRAVERLLFTEPLVAVKSNAEHHQSLKTVLDKLRLILSCFVFYDQERLGAVQVLDFEAILRRLKYLWPNERLTEEQAAGATRVQDSLTFENTILAARKRFGDVQGDGRIGYLDFWAMLYIMGVRTKTLLKFREIPSFCKDYKLEVSPGLHDMLSVYMGRSSSLLLPRGIQTTTGTGNARHRYKQQAQRPSGGISHDGVYVVDRPFITRSLSMQELLEQRDATDPTTGLYVDGMVPALRQSVSTAALETHNIRSGNGVGAEPVVMGVRTIGPRPKPVAFLTVSSVATDLDEHAEKSPRTSLNLLSPPDVGFDESSGRVFSPESSMDAFTNVYIQFPNITPRQTRVVVDSKSPRARVVVGSMTGAAHDEEASSWQRQLLEEHEQETRDRQVVHEDHKRRMTLAKEQAATAANAAAAANQQVAAAHRRHHHANASPSREKVSPAKAADTTSVKSPLETHDDHGVAAKRAVSQPREEVAVVIPSVDESVGKAPTHGVATIGTMKKHARDLDHHDESGDGKHLSGWEAPPSSNHVTLDSVAKPAVVAVAVALPSVRVEKTAVSAVLSEGAPVAVETLVRSVEEACREQNEEDGGKEAEGESDGGEESDEADEEDEGGDEGDDDDDNNDGGDAGTEVVASAAESKEPIAERECDVADSKANADEPPQVENSRETSPTSQDTEPHTPAAGEPPEENAVTDEAHQKSVVLETLAAPAQQQAEREQTEHPQTATLDVADAQPTLTPSVVNSMSSPAPPNPVANAPESLPRKMSVIAAVPQQQLPAAHAKPGSSESRHRFKFSQQPKFKANASVMSNPYKSRQWKPLDDSDSGGDNGAADDADAYDDSVAVEDMRLRLSKNSMASLNKQHSRRNSTRMLGLSTLPLTAGLSRRNLRSFAEASEASRRETSGPVRLDEEAERALYGGHAASYLGEGIVFSAEAEAEMQRKWLEFFGNAEASMFSPIKQVLEQREEAQRREEEMQSRLMKKRLEQQNQDTMRLRRTASETATTSSSTKTTERTTRQDATLRVRRMTREACLQVQQELKYGETVSGEMAREGQVQYYHFVYAADSESHACSIITLKLHSSKGDTEMFLSTETKTPCSSDFMWRSVDQLSTSSTVATDTLEGRKIVLFPSDIARVVSSKEPLIGGAPSPTVFYVAVVSLTPSSAFTLGVMASGQKAEPSRAIQTVDSLIAHFNQLAKTYEGQAIRRVELLSSSSSTRPSRDRKSSSVDRLRAFLASASSDMFEDEEPGGRRRSSVVRSRRQSTAGSVHQGEADASGAADVHQPIYNGSEEDEEDDEGDEEEDDDDDGQSASDRSSFQQLLEVIGDKHGFGLKTSQSFVLGVGVNAEQQDFLVDEELRLEETKAKLSPVRVQVESHDAGDVDGGGEMDAIAVVTERRLSQADSAHAKLLQRVGARVKQRLSPLKAAAKASDKSSVSLRVARFEPKLVAYSLSSLPPPKHPLQPQSSSIPPSKANSKANAK